MIRQNISKTALVLSLAFMSGAGLYAADAQASCDDGRLAHARAFYERYTPYSHYVAAGLTGAAAVGCYVKREALKNGAQEFGQTIAPLGAAVCDLGNAVKHGFIGGAYLIGAAGKLGINTLCGLAAIAKGATEFVREEPKLVVGLTVGGVAGWYAHKWTCGSRNSRGPQPHEVVVRPVQPGAPQQNNVYF